MKLTNLQSEDRIFALFKGEPKTGKDVAAHSFAALGSLFSYDLDGRMESVAHYFNKVVPRPDIMNNIEYERFTDFFTLYQHLEQMKVNCPCRTIVMSSLTSLARKSMNTMLATRNPAALDKNEKLKAKTRGGIPMHIIEDFGGEANAIMLTLDALQVISIKFNVNVIMTAHVINPELGAYSKRTLLTGGKKIAAEIPVSFNEAYHFYVQTMGGLEIGADDADRSFIAKTQSTTLDWASTALGLPETIDFTAGKTSGVFYEEIMRYVNLAKKEEVIVEL